MHVVSLLGYAPAFGWAWAEALGTQANVSVVSLNATTQNDSKPAPWHLDLVDLPAASLTTPLARASNTRRLLALVRQIEAETGETVDAIHGNFYSSLSPFGTTTIPQIVTEHTSLFLRQRWPEMAEPAIAARSTRLAQHVYRRCAAVFAISGDQRQALREIGVDERRLSTVPNPVDLHRFEWIHRPAGGGRLMTACRLEPTKNLETLIEAVHILRPTQPNISLDIFGAGTLGPALQRRIDELELNNVVHLPGHIGVDALVHQLHNHDLYVCPSKVESFGLPIIESLATGLPVVSTPVGVAKDLQRDPALGMGITVTSGWEAIDLATAIGHRLEHPYPVGESIRSTLDERFAPSAVGTAALTALTRSHKNTLVGQ